MSFGGSKKPLIVPIFIPNQGCPHRCIFCNQEKITGQSNAHVNRTFVRHVLDMAIKSVRFASCAERQVAFYGGSFTSLPNARMIELLEAVKPYLGAGHFQDIRVSTRPDEIDEKRLEIMKSLGVSTVELGAQSMEENVLSLSKRGHTPEHTVASFHLLKRYGFKVGIQLIPGLPGDSASVFSKTVADIVRLGPDMVRLYPALVIRGTELAKWYKEGKYRALTLREAIGICLESCTRLEDRGIPVIRMGLMSSPSLLEKGQILAGPWHTAFGFLVRSAMYQKKIEPYLPGKGRFPKIGIRLFLKDIPLIRGYKNEGLRLIEEKTGSEISYIKADDSVSAGRIAIDVL